MDHHEREYQALMLKANEYHREAKWQEKLRVLQDALVICDEPHFLDADQRRQRLYFDVAGIWRRLGQYSRVEETLQHSLTIFPGAASSFKASILGELGVMARHNSRFTEAADYFREQARLASEDLPSIEAEAEICRAVGNEGMVYYNLSQQTNLPHANKYLDDAITKTQERIDRARHLQQRLRTEAPQSKYTAMAQTWEVIGLDRLTLCLSAAGRHAEALEHAELSQRTQSREDPTVAAFSRFFYGKTLWHNNRAEEALQQWNAPQGVCSSPMAFCKEPGAEHNTYLELMSHAGVNFDSYDEQGFSALDHAVLSDSPDAWRAIPIVENALRRGFRQECADQQLNLSEAEIDQVVEYKIGLRKRQAELRRQYRSLLQEHIRPELRKKSVDAFQILREKCAKILSEDNKDRRMFSDFHFVRYTDFKEHKKLPVSAAGLTKQFARGESETANLAKTDENDFVVFISYRWIGGNTPDDENNAQWKRMVNAVEGFLAANPEVNAEHLSLWLDYACIDQENTEEKERGIDALPLAITQCNAMISLVDDVYYQRAWCTVEVMLMCALVKSYGLHQWWEHEDESLRSGDFERTFDVNRLELSNEEMDRPKIDFLMRQSKLLGRDGA